jgi:hypothetical protein
MIESDVTSDASGKVFLEHCELREVGSASGSTPNRVVAAIEHVNIKPTVADLGRYADVAGGILAVVPHLSRDADLKNHLTIVCVFNQPLDCFFYLIPTRMTEAITIGGRKIPSVVAIVCEPGNDVRQELDITPAGEDPERLEEV